MVRYRLHVSAHLYFMSTMGLQLVSDTVQWYYTLLIVTQPANLKEKKEKISTVPLWPECFTTAVVIETDEGMGDICSIWQLCEQNNKTIVFLDFSFHTELY